MPNTLYVGDLSPKVTEAMLYSMFTAVGPVASIRICKDYVATSKGPVYAYVNFHLAVDAERALDTLNHSKILNRPCRIMWSQRDPNSLRTRKSGEGNIFVSNLAEEIDNRTLQDIFSMFGNVLSCKVVCDPATGKSWGQGFVHYATDTSANKAIEKVNGMVVSGKALYVTKWKSIQEREEYNKEHFVSVYVKNFPEDWDEEQLKELASEFGEYRDCVIQKDENGKSRGFGFLNFKNSGDAKKAVEGLHEREIKSKGGEIMKLYASRAQSKRERQRILKEKFSLLREDEANRNIYVKGLLDTVDQEQLKTVFSKIGEIKSCRVMREKNGVSKGFGFVLFVTEEAAQRAIKEFHAKEIGVLGEGPLHVAIANKSKPRTRMGNDSIWADSGQGGGFSGSRRRLSNQIGPWMRYNNQTPMTYPGYRNPGFPGPYNSNFQSMGVPFLPYNHIPYKHQGNQHQVPRTNPLDRELERLMSRPQKEQKQLIGERIFSAIEKKMGKIKEAGKITGMLLEMDSAALINLLRQPALLHEKILQATEVLRKFQESSEKAVE